MKSKIFVKNKNYIKTNEELTQNNIKIGDYVIIKDTFNKPPETKADWHHSYGIVNNILIKKDKYYNNKFYLIKLFSTITNDMIQSEENLPDFLYTTEDEQEVWFVDDYVFKCENKEEFDELVQEIEMEKNINKYNI